MSFVTLTDIHEVRCRNDHECAWCGGFLIKGELAMTRSYIWEDGPQRDWMHPECSNAMGRCDPPYLSEGWMPGDWVRGSVEWA
jgi:hypothetical protein